MMPPPEEAIAFFIFWYIDTCIEKCSMMPPAEEASIHAMSNDQLCMYMYTHLHMQIQLMQAMAATLPPGLPPSSGGSSGPGGGGPPGGGGGGPPKGDGWLQQSPDNKLDIRPRQVIE